MAQVTAISVCVPVYRVHAEPNLATLARDLPAALGGLEGELVVALNGLPATDAGIDLDDPGADPPRRHVDLGINRGVSPAWNAAAKAAAGEVLVFANDDVLLGPGSLALLHGALVEHPQAGVVGPVGTDWDIAAVKHLAWVDTGERAPGELVPCDVVSGFLFAMRRETYERAGGFDERYAPASFEELDFCTTVTRRLGLSCYAVAGVPHEHTWGISRRYIPWKRIRHNGRSETLFSIHRRNRRHFLAKWSAR